ncbi:MAG: homocysteine S-methyltransferase family protein [Lentisphaeria bacterium]|nr:homocysteine S-methyltransferase family protein [Lentisphaeria bacterium]
MRFEDQPFIILDGACGTNLQLMDIPDSAWEGRDGCNELLNVTAPELIEGLHRQFFDAGAMAVETNTFGASRVVLAEYDLADQVTAINQAAVAAARRAAGGEPDRYVVGSIGPTTKLLSLGHITRDELVDNYREQVTALLEAGVDALIIETCQDLAQVKTALITCFEAREKTGVDVPVMVSLTIEQTGTMLVGSDIAAACAALEPFPVFSLGLNCATGPEEMESHLRFLSQNWPRRISCVPNQGLPEVVNGQTCYRLEPDAYAAKMRHMVDRFGVSVVGGCCGTTPEHIRRLVEAVRGVRVPTREVTA